jgi:hypothetical protein
MSTNRQPTVTISAPAPLMEWVRADAKAMGMTVSGFICFHLALTKNSKLEPELRALRVRVEAIERELNARKEWPENQDSMAPAVRPLAEHPRYDEIAGLYGRASE